MRISTTLLASLLLCLASGSLSADELPEVKTGFDLVPINAAAGFSVHNLKALQEEGDVFIKNAGLEKQFGIRPSQLVTMAYGYLGVTSGRDDTLPAGIFIANLIEARVLNRSGFRDIEKLLVVAVGVSDKEKMASNFGLAKSELKPEEIIKRPRKDGEFGELIYLKDQHLYMGDNERAILSVARGRRLSQAISAYQSRRFSRSDMLLHIGTTAWGAGWVQMVQNAKDHAASLAEEEADPETGLSREMVELIADCLPAVENVLFSVAIDEKGLEFQAMPRFRTEGQAAAKKLLRMLRAGDQSSSLDALPNRNMIVSQSVRSDGSQNREFVRVAVKSFLNIWDRQGIIGVVDRPNFVGLFDAVWGRLKGNRLAFYGNQNPAEEGLFSMVAILDTDNPAEFLKEMRQLSRFAKPGELKLEGDGRRAQDIAEVKTLIEQLGDADFRKRQSATLKLSLIGPPALPFLKKAVDSTDREVAVRARRLKTRIEKFIEARKNDVLSQSLLAKISARWGDFPAAETRQGLPIDIVKMDLDEKSKSLASSLQETFGPDWSKIRLAVYEKQIIVLLGSNVGLLDETIKNLKDKKPGLDERAILAEFSERAPANRRTEFHLRVRQFVNLYQGPNPAQQDGSGHMSSFSLGVGENSLELHFWVPNQEVRVLNLF